MNYLKRCLIGLLVLMLALSVQAALAEEEEMPPEEFYFVPGQDLVVYDNPRETVTLKGNQSARIYADGYDLEFLVKNHINESIMTGLCAFANDNIILQDYNSSPNSLVFVPANGSVTLSVHVNSSLIKQYNEGNITEAQLAEIKDFEGIHTLDIIHDSYCVNGGEIAISYWAVVHF